MDKRLGSERLVNYVSACEIVAVKKKSYATLARLLQYWQSKGQLISE